MEDDSPERPAPEPCPRCGTPREPGAPCSACILRGAAESASDHARRASAGAPDVSVVDTALPDYEVQVLLGRGGMGAVYRARHRRLDRLVAIKLLTPPAALSEADRLAFTERFEREARVLAKLEHPNIVRLYDYGVADTEPPLPYLVLEHVEGASLRALMADGRLTPRDVLEIAPQLCEALQAAHDIGVVHRDVKPENILVDERGRARIADFGLAKLAEEEPGALGLTRSGEAMGTPHYMAPEQVRGAGRVDHRADLYALGVVLYEMLTGELPIGRFAEPGAGEPRLRRVVMRALESRPEARYQAASDVGRDIAGSGEAEHLPSAPGRGGAGPPARRPAAEARGSASMPTWSREVRTWLYAAEMLVALFLPWAHIDQEVVTSRLGGGGLEIFDPDPSISSHVTAYGHSFSAQVVSLAIPLWLVVFGYFVASAARSAHRAQATVPEWIPRSLLLGGAAAVIVCVLAFLGSRHDLQLGAGFAFVVAFLTVFSELRDWSQDRARSNPAPRSRLRARENAAHRQLRLRRRRRRRGGLRRSARDAAG